MSSLAQKLKYHGRYLRQQVAVQSTFMATTDYFWGISALGLLYLLLVAIEWGVRRPAKQVA
ncbi:hypothetical protein [Variovorax paradoxus]|uniref:hypothetical protein n=1 Tax=Variovorax paradoxus TaxID=34073 RepID=UPI0012BCC414|nr:hypothetical protein [Variovorax paradoxus]